ncbi:MAG: ComF family protein [Deltaproteobacteria bacterium]|nr:ComF family protein [Deltaproteobacteria bacterium]MBW2168705.1 ComF family protein [Deltaproteobacteria bacterium]
MISLLKNLIDIIYPPRCPICREFLRKDPLTGQYNTSSFCPTCFADFRRISTPLCSVCGRPFADGTDEDHLCEDCLRKRPLYKVAGAPYVYDGPLMTAIHQFKYGGKSYLADSLGPLLAQFAKSWVKNPDGFLTLPVPLHQKRLRERGFNQSLLLARHVAGELHTELDFLSLRRVRYTLPQTGLGKEERRKNVRGAFMLENPEVFKDKPILLVDDVATTGNTLNECARVLRKAGCKDIFCMVLARTGSF